MCYISVLSGSLELAVNTIQYNTMRMRRVIGFYGMKPEFWRFGAKVSIGNTRNWPM
jgi:hypothetical protein